MDGLRAAVHCTEPVVHCTGLVVHCTGLVVHCTVFDGFP
jgi:hypothetical protein